MAPCSPNEVSIEAPDAPSGPSIPGFGLPFALKTPNLSPFPDGFPEDLLELLDELQMLIPPGALKPALNPNFGKDVFDAIMKLLDQFFPFLMLYKFFLPILNMIICIIEVLCALTNPFKLIRALKRLFRTCIPEFLNLFPIFAFIIMIISLLLLLLALIEYIINQILKFIKALLRNIIALNKAFNHADQKSVLAIAKKLGSLLCIFQNLFVLLSIFNTIIQIIKDILSLLFHIPPCEDGDPNDQDLCCTPDVCPAIVKTQYDRSTGTLQYLTRVVFDTGAPIFGGTLLVERRPESWQLFDSSQEQAQQFINIINAFDVAISPKPTFFPTDSIYKKDTAPKQAPYLIDLRLFYNPADWGRAGTPRFIKFLNCIMTLPPTDQLAAFDLSSATIPNGVVKLAGGAGFEDDGITPLNAFAPDGITPLDPSVIASLENFIHKPDITSAGSLTNGPADGFQFSNMSYTFKPNLAVLLSKDLVTLGCEPSLAVNRGFINQAFAGDIGFKAAQLNDIFNKPNAKTGLNFPDPAGTQACLTASLTTLRNNLTPAGVAQFQTTANLCLQQLKNETNGALSSLISLGVEPCNSTFAVQPSVQFTTQPIVVSVNLKERNSLPLTNTLPPEVGTDLAQQLSAHITFGQISNFTYDGNQAFTANLTSDVPGEGQIMLSFDNNIFCTNIIPDDNTIDPSRVLQSLDYKFVYTPVAAIGLPTPPTAEGDTDGKPRRDAGDTSGDGT